jgi:hypothetical protein
MNLSDLSPCRKVPAGNVILNLREKILNPTFIISMEQDYQL